MQPPDVPGIRRYLHAAAFWLAIAVVAGLVVLQALSGKALVNGQNLMLVFVPSFGVALAGTAALWLARSKAQIRRMSVMVAIGALAGFALTAGIAFAVSYALRQPGLWLEVLVPGNLVGGAIAGAYLGRAVPREQEWWPTPRAW